eukprot:353793-Chlamydomonas_euryale.AAC.5
MYRHALVQGMGGNAGIGRLCAQRSVYLSNPGAVQASEGRVVHVLYKKGGRAGRMCNSKSGISSCVRGQGGSGGGMGTCRVGGLRCGNACVRFSVGLEHSCAGLDACVVLMKSVC